jgi:hypothetical protein
MDQAGSGIDHRASARGAVSNDDHNNDRGTNNNRRADHNDDHNDDPRPRV